MAATPRDNRVYIKTEPADEALRPQNARQSNSVLSMDMQLQWCDQQNTKIKTELDQYSNRGPLPSIETQNSSGGFSSNAGFVKTEPSELIVRRVDEMKTFEEEENIGLHDSCDVGVTEVKTEPDGELALKVEPDSSPYTSPQEDNVGLSSLADTGDWEGLKEELMSPPEPVPVRLLAAGSRGLLRIDVEDPLHPVESEIFKKEPEDMDMDQNSLDFDVAKVKHESLSLSASASGISCEASTSGEDEVSDASSDRRDVFEGPSALNSSSTRSKIDVMVHDGIHTGEEPYKCDEAFTCYKEYKKHRGQTKCYSCDEIFSFQSDYIIHQRVHTGERPFKCDQCDKAFRRKGQLTSHKRIHTGPFACNQCDQTFAWKYHLAQHQSIHHSIEKKFKCDKCDKAFRYWNELTRHVSFHAGETTFKCTFCHQIFPNESALIEHRQVHIGDKDKPFACNLCDKKFIHNYRLIHHQRIHTGEKPFKCDQCDKAFYRKQGLMQHREKHTGERPFPCDQCDKVFKRKGTLTIHQRIHTREKPFKCDLCPKAFCQINSLVRHQQIHTG